MNYRDIEASELSRRISVSRFLIVGSIVAVAAVGALLFYSASVDAVLNPYRAIGVLTLMGAVVEASNVVWGLGRLRPRMHIALGVVMTVLGAVLVAIN